MNWKIYQLGSRQKLNIFMAALKGCQLAMILDVCLHKCSLVREREREIERGGGVRKIQREIKTKKKTNIRSYSSNVRYPATNKIQLTR